MFPKTLGGGGVEQVKKKNPRKISLHIQILEKMK